MFARNAIFHWSGEGTLAGLHLGSSEAASVAATIAQSVQPGSIQVEELAGADENLDVVARVTLQNPASPGPTMQTLIHGVFRFDETGRIALLYLTPYDIDAVRDFIP